MTIEETSLISRIDKAITGLSASDSPLASASIARLREKRQLIIDGDYVLRDVTEECIAPIGGHIAIITKAYWTGNGNNNNNRPRPSSAQVTDDRSDRLAPGAADDEITYAPSAASGPLSAQVTRRV